MLQLLEGKNKNADFSRLEIMKFQMIAKLPFLKRRGQVIPLPDRMNLHVYRKTWLALLSVT